MRRECHGLACRRIAPALELCLDVVAGSTLGCTAGRPRADDVDQMRDVRASLWRERGVGAVTLRGEIGLDPGLPRLGRGVVQRRSNRNISPPVSARRGRSAGSDNERAGSEPRAFYDGNISFRAHRALSFVLVGALVDDHQRPARLQARPGGRQQRLRSEEPGAAQAMWSRSKTNGKNSVTRSKAAGCATKARGS